MGYILKIIKGRLKDSNKKQLTNYMKKTKSKNRKPDFIYNSAKGTWNLRTRCGELVTICEDHYCKDCYIVVWKDYSGKWQTLTYGSSPDECRYDFRKYRLTSEGCLIKHVPRTMTVGELLANIGVN